MAFFSDTFTDTDAVLLQNHTPTLGTSWTRLWGTTGTNAEINTNRCRSDGDLNSGVMYTADATYPSADYDITCTLVSVVGNNDRPIYLLVRIQDQENMYGVRIENTASESSLYKKVSGTWTAIGSLFTRPLDGSVIKLEIIGTALKFYDDGVEIASATVSDISAAGKAGIGFGGGAELVTSGDDGSTSNVIDTLSVNDLGSGGTEHTSSVSGGITPSGTATKETQKVTTGAITPSGALLKAAGKVLTGTLTSLGELVKSTGKALSGAITPSGDLTSIRTYLKDLAGSITPSGAILRDISKAVSGSVTPSGAISRAISKAVAGTLTSAGGIVRSIAKFFSGILAPSGTSSGEKQGAVTTPGVWPHVLYPEPILTRTPEAIVALKPEAITTFEA